MHASTDIRAQIEADALLQREINLALLAVADTLVSGSDQRVVRILTRTLETSWAEHVNFQESVVFPILVNRQGEHVREVIDSRRLEHASLSQQHARIGRYLDSLLEPGQIMADGLEELLRGAHATRISHLELDTVLRNWLPETFTETELSLCATWASTRRHLRFPLNLLRQAGRTFPRLGGRLH